MGCFALLENFNSFLLDSSCSALLLFYISTQHTCGFWSVKNLLPPKVQNKKGADHLIAGDRLHPFFCCYWIWRSYGLSGSNPLDARYWSAFSLPSDHNTWRMCSIAWWRLSYSISLMPALSSSILLIQSGSFHRRHAHTMKSRVSMVLPLRRLLRVFTCIPSSSAVLSLV